MRLHLLEYLIQPRLATWAPQWTARLENPPRPTLVGRAVTNHCPQGDVRSHIRSMFSTTAAGWSPIWDSCVRRALAFTLILAAVEPLLPNSDEFDAPEQAGRGQTKRFAKDLHTLIETDQNAYRIGDRIALRVSLVNTSDQRIASSLPEPAGWATRHLRAWATP